MSHNKQHSRGMSQETLEEISSALKKLAISSSPNLASKSLNKLSYALYLDEDSDDDLDDSNLSDDDDTYYPLGSYSPASSTDLENSSNESSPSSSRIGSPSNSCSSLVYDNEQVFPKDPTNFNLEPNPIKNSLDVDLPKILSRANLCSESYFPHIKKDEELFFTSRIEKPGYGLKDPFYFDGFCTVTKDLNGIYNINFNCTGTRLDSLKNLYFGIRYDIIGDLQLLLNRLPYHTEDLRKFALSAFTKIQEYGIDISKCQVEINGHSLGAFLAKFLFMDIIANKDKYAGLGINPNKITCLAFDGPGDGGLLKHFKDALLNPEITELINNNIYCINASAVSLLSEHLGQKAYINNCHKSYNINYLPKYTIMESVLGILENIRAVAYSHGIENIRGTIKELKDVSFTQEPSLHHNQIFKYPLQEIKCNLQFLVLIAKSEIENAVRSNVKMQYSIDPSETLGDLNFAVLALDASNAINVLYPIVRYNMGKKLEKVKDNINKTKKDLQVLKENSYQYYKSTKENCKMLVENTKKRAKELKENCDKNCESFKKEVNNVTQKLKDTSSLYYESTKETMYVGIQKAQETGEEYLNWVKEGVTNIFDSWYMSNIGESDNPEPDLPLLGRSLGEFSSAH